MIALQTAILLSTDPSLENQDIYIHEYIFEIQILKFLKFDTSVLIFLTHLLPIRFHSLLKSDMTSPSKKLTSETFLELQPENDFNLKSISVIGKVSLFFLHKQLNGYK